MSTQNARQADRRQENRCCAAYARIRPRDFRDRQSDELVEFFLPQSLRRKSDSARPVLGGVNQDRADPNGLLLLLFFLWDRRGHARFTLFLLLSVHCVSSDSCFFSHIWFFFVRWG